MAKVYKVWIEVEEFDEDRDEGENLGASFGCSGTFATFEDAHALAAQIHQAAKDAPGWTE